MEGVIMEISLEIKEKVEAILDRGFNYRGEEFVKDTNDLMKVIEEAIKMKEEEMSVDRKRKIAVAFHDGMAHVVNNLKEKGIIVEFNDKGLKPYLESLQKEKDSGKDISVPTKKEEVNG